MKLINGHRYRGTASAGFLDVFSAAAAAATVLQVLGFRDVGTTTTIPSGWPSDHRDADVFAYGTWDRPTGEYEIPEEVTWIDDVTPEARTYSAGRWYVIVSPLPVGLRDVLTAETLGAFLRSNFTDVSETVHDDETLFSFKSAKPFQWTWDGLRTSNPEKGDGAKEFELTPGQREYVEGSANWVKSAVKGAAVVGVLFLAANYFLNRKG